MVRSKIYIHRNWEQFQIWLAGSCCLVATTLVFSTPVSGAPNDIILNEFNAVGSDEYLGDDASSKTDDVLGRIQGNGQNWLEFLIVEDHMDLRGFVLEWAFDNSPSSSGSGTLTFTQNPLWGDLRQGMLLTITEWQEAWYNEKNTANFNFSRVGGVNGLGNNRGDDYKPLKHERFVDFSSDTAWSPDLGDFHINVQAGQRHPVTGEFQYFSLSGMIVDPSDNTSSVVGIDNNAGLFAVNNNSWEMTLKNAMGNIVQGPIGEEYSTLLNVNAKEVGKWEGAFDNAVLGYAGTVTDYKTTTVVHYDDGNQSTFGKKNRGGGFEQGLTGLRTWFDMGNVIGRNTTMSGLVFNDNTAWMGGDTPSSTQDALFDQGSGTAYTVVVDANDEVQRLLVRNDRVRFDLDGNTLTANADQAYEASVIAQTSGDVAEATILGGGTVTATVMHVAEQAGSYGDLIVTGSGTNLSLSEALAIGGRASTFGGTGSVTVDTGASVVVSSPAANVLETVKVFAAGTLTTNGGTVTVGSGTGETVPGTLRIYPDGNLDVRGGTLDVTTIQLSGGVISGYGTIPTAIMATVASNLFVPQFDDGLAGELVLSGPISGTLTGSLTKRGDGILLLNNSNTYMGSTTISDGLLQADDGVGLPRASTLRLRNGRLQTSGSFNRSLGAAAGQVNWSDTTDSGGGGFSAQGGNLVVNFGGSGATVAWGAGNFVPNGEVLHLNSDDADAELQIVNGIDLGSSGSNAHEIRVANNGASLDDLAVLSGVVFASGGVQGIHKSGEGTLKLSGNNTYNGVTTIDNGQLRAQNGVGLPAGSALRFRGGILESWGTFARNIGSDSGNVNWTDGTDEGDGGFAALEEALEVTLAGGANLAWNVGGFVPTDRDLLFGTEVANQVVTLHNSIDLGAVQRTVRVFDNAASFADRAVLAGVLFGTGGIVKKGNGELELSAMNLYTGTTSVDNGHFILTGSVAGPVRVKSSGEISGGGTIFGVLENSGTHVVRSVETLKVNGTAMLNLDSQLTVTENYSQIRATETGDFHVLAASSVVGQFATPGVAGIDSHLENGYFLRNIQYHPTDVTVNILAARSGDTDGDRDVDITDFNTLATNFDPVGSNGSYSWTRANFDGDRDIDITDFFSLSSNFSPAGYAVQAQVVPEPTGILCWAVALVFLFGAARYARRTFT